MADEIIIYHSDELPERIEVRLKDETVWLTQAQIAELFAKGRTTITEHIRNIFAEGELIEDMVCRNFRHTTQHGAIAGKKQTNTVKYYNLDVIISVGYRVKSKQGTHFRIWATNVLREYLLKGYVLNQRMNRIENSFEHLTDKVDEISLQIKSKEIPNQGVFFEGQVFDAYELVSKIIRSAKKSIVLIDNYINEATLAHLAKRNNEVKIILLTKNITKTLALDVKKANEQYKGFEIKAFNKSHDHFLIIDETEIYHIGASLKGFRKKVVCFFKNGKKFR